MPLATLRASSVPVTLPQYGSGIMSILETAEILGGLGTVAIALIAVWTAIKAVNSQREATAKDIYRDYLKLAFKNPWFANPREFNDPSNFRKNEQYRWFVAFMLNSCDEIARTKSRDKGWRKTIRLDLRMHAEYLKSPEFDEDGGWGLYSRKLKCIANEALD
jgi:hypothetical protein